MCHYAECRYAECRGAILTGECKMLKIKSFFQSLNVSGHLPSNGLFIVPFKTRIRQSN
jgi:hypothetical protein